VSRSGSTTRDRTRGARRPADPRSAADRGVAGGRRPSAAERLPSRRPGSGITTLPRRRGWLGRRHARRAITALVVLGLGWALLAGPLLAVRTVQVDGVGTLPADLVRESAGIEVGLPLLRVDVAAAQERVAQLPQVASVEVARGWPSSVVITVVERVPVAIVGTPGRRSLVDAEGVLFDSVTGQAPPGVVPLDVTRPGSDDPATMAGLAAVSALPTEVRRDVVRAAAASAEDISLTLTDGTTVRWGDAERSSAKAVALAGLLEQIDAGRIEPAQTIDVSTPSAVVLR
jgi:cell division protein FtsQ